MTSEYALTLEPRTLENADPGVRPHLENAKKHLGFVPNMYLGMANLPALLDTYLHGYAAFRTGSGLTPAEQEVVFLAVSRENGCAYCVSAHSYVADAVSKVPGPVTDAIRDGQPVPDARLGALAAFARAMVARRGLPLAREVRAFLDAGYTERHVLAIVLAIAVKTASNYSNHLLHTPVDDAFAARAWNG